MKNNTSMAFLIGIWCLFIIWEFQIQSIDTSDMEYLVRYDLMVLPILLLITAYTLYQRIKDDQ